MLLIDALYINSGGGKVLLEYLVEILEERNLPVFYLFDERCLNVFQDIPDDRKIYLKASVINRYRVYSKMKGKYSKVLCLGNVPPITSLNTPVYTYFHNISLLDQPSVYSLKERFLKKLKGALISFLASNTTCFVVQTEYVKNRLLKFLHAKEEKCLVIPYFRKNKEFFQHQVKNNSFVYISNGYSHKNHQNLIKSWYILAERGLKPCLNLTVTKDFVQINELINQAIYDGLNIVNHGFTNVYELLSRNQFLIYPSFCESFGLGLAEAVESGCNVIAADLPYVYEIVDPSEVFDPSDPISIADSVVRSLNNTYKSNTVKIENKIDDLINLLFS